MIMGLSQNLDSISFSHPSRSAPYSTVPSGSSCCLSSQSLGRSNMKGKLWESPVTLRVMGKELLGLQALCSALLLYMFGLLVEGD